MVNSILFICTKVKCRITTTKNDKNIVKLNLSTKQDGFLFEFIFLTKFNIIFIFYRTG